VTLEPARRVVQVVLVGPGTALPTDPDAAATTRRGISLHPVAGGVAAVVAMIEVIEGSPIGLVGWSEGGRAALQVAATLPDRIDRLAIVATPAPLGAGETLSFQPADVAAKTLLVHGGADPIAGGRDGRWWQQRLPSARLEMTPNLGGEALLEDRWERILSFLAPRAGR
jgi:pimeloyl-ACP methyl ester carboxylesterase